MTAIALTLACLILLVALLSMVAIMCKSVTSTIANTQQVATICSNDKPMPDYTEKYLVRDLEDRIRRSEEHVAAVRKHVRLEQETTRSLLADDPLALSRALGDMAPTHARDIADAERRLVDSETSLQNAIRFIAERAAKENNNG